MGCLQASAPSSAVSRLHILRRRPILTVARISCLPCTSLRPRLCRGLVRPGPALGKARRPALDVRAMVNVDLSPSVLMGVGLIGAGVSLWQVRQVKPEISRDSDVVVSCISLLVGGILIFQGWRLDPLLLFGQIMTTGAALCFAIEALRLREEHYEDVEKAEKRTFVDRRGPGGDGGASLQLPPPTGAPFQQEQQQQQQWDGTYSRPGSGYYDVYQAQQPEQQPGATASRVGYTYAGGEYYATPTATGSYEQQQQQQVQYGAGAQAQGTYVEPDYALPPTDQRGGFYGGYQAAPAEYVFPAEPTPAGSSGASYGSYNAADSGGASAGAADWGPDAGGQRQQQRQAGAGGGNLLGGRGIGGSSPYQVEDWD